MLEEHSHGVLAVLFLALQAAVWGAHRGGRRLARAGSPPLPTEASSALLALVGLLSAFTVSMAVSRFEERKDLVLAEANAIGTAALRTALLPPPFAEESRRLLGKYAAQRTRWGEAERTAAIERRIEADDARLHARLWSIAVAAAERRRDPQHALYVSALNDVIDVQAERVHSRGNRVPETVIVLLAVVALLAVSVAAFLHGRNGNRHALDHHVLAFAVWLVIALIVDLDQPRRGWVQVSQASLAAVAESLARPE